MSFLPDDLQAKVAGATPSIRKNMPGLFAGEESITEDLGEDVIEPSIKTTFELSKVLEEMKAEGFSFSFNDKTVSGVVNPGDIDLNPIHAAMFASDGYTIIGTSEKEVRVIHRLQEVDNNTIPGFEIVERKKS